MVAEAIDGEIVNADSRQVYRDIPVGTGAPSAAMMRRVPHHLFGFVDPCERYSAGAYVHDALAAIDGIIARGRMPIVVGGTGLYVEALAGTMPMDRPIADDEVRLRVRREAHLHPQHALHDWLRALSPASAARVTDRDLYRTLRALESALMARSGRALPARDGAGAASHISMPVAILRLADGELRARIESRVRSMFDAGLVDEALAVRRRCADAPALTGLGFAEALCWLDGEATRDDAIAATVRRTIRYAKRQRTWFGRMRDAVEVDASSTDVAAAAIARWARERARAK